jgi:recombinational DNA repair protein (RecF pathway)
MSESQPYVRRAVEACADCGAPDAPYAYLQDGRHYCVRCARVKLVRDKIRPAGKREGDLTLDDVLFLELPAAEGPEAEVPEAGAPEA